jgi:hypothetical protein
MMSYKCASITIKKVLKLFLMPLFIIDTAYLIYTIPSTFGIYKSVDRLPLTLNIIKPIYTITLDNQNADIQQGTTEIYEKHSLFI